jgi:Uri superfamily endonuclease
MTQTMRRGTYVLLLDFFSPRDLKVGSLGILHFNPGRYCYVGSAMGGLDQRLSRHLRKEKTIRWHIDNLTVSADRVEAWESYPDPIPECDLARMAEACGMVPVHPGFGCSDCRCRTHLFTVPEGTDRTLISRCGLHSFTSVE